MYIPVIEICRWVFLSLYVWECKKPNKFIWLSVEPTVWKSNHPQSARIHIWKIYVNNYTDCVDNGIALIWMRFISFLFLQTIVLNSLSSMKVIWCASHTWKERGEWKYGERRWVALFGALLYGKRNQQLLRQHAMNS